MSDSTTDLIEPQAELTQSPATFISRYVSYQESEAAAAGVASDSVYTPKLTTDPPTLGYDLLPRTVYFYYVRIDTDGKLRVNHYTHRTTFSIPHDSLRAVVQQLVDNVRGSNLNPPPDPDRNFQNIEWTRKSYIALFVDEENWDLHKNGDPLEGIRFVTTVAGTTPNHTFYDAVDLSIDVKNKTTGVVSQRSAIAFVNHMKRDALGNDLVLGDRQKFKFDIIFDVEFADQSSVGMTVIFDPDGTNVGPPVPPPPP